MHNCQQAQAEKDGPTTTEGPTTTQGTPSGAGPQVDQIGGGFHRYSTDEFWLVPHFEKMLYDNALISSVYIDAYKITKNTQYLRIVKETLDYIILEMTGNSCEFYSSQDADSEGIEGKYFTWELDEIEKILGKDNSKIFCEYYGVQKNGNFEGTNI